MQLNVVAARGDLIRPRWHFRIHYRHQEEYLQSTIVRLRGVFWLQYSKSQGSFEVVAESCQDESHHSRVRSQSLDKSMGCIKLRRSHAFSHSSQASERRQQLGQLMSSATKAFEWCHTDYSEGKCSCWTKEGCSKEGYSKKEYRKIGEQKQKASAHRVKSAHCKSFEDK